jgi:acyl-CoA hydrolase
MAASPTVLLEALAEHATGCENLTLMQLHLEHAAAVCGDALQGHLRHRVFFAGKDTRELINAGVADYVPIFLSELPKLFRRREQQIDTALIQVSSPDQHGNCTLGVSVEATRAACEVARTVIAHVNPSMPRTHGDAFIPLEDIDFAYVEDAPLITVDARPETEETARIGDYVATLIDDGDCLQAGIGAIPDAALANLRDRRHLGIHTEMFSEGMLQLVECGAVDNSLKKRQRGKVVTGFAMGSDALYRFVDDNPEMAFLDIEYVNDPTVIARNRAVVSINSALQIDLSGQVCADSIGPRVYSGVGGQLDFVLGAAFSEGGKSIIALPSTARQGAVSRLVGMLTQGSGVVTTRAHVDYIVTEYGIARLRGRALAERARALIDIAHPDFRESLLREARDELGLRL